MKTSFLTHASLALLYLTSISHAKSDDTLESYRHLDSILSDPKFKPNHLGHIIPGRYIVEFEDEYEGLSKDFVSRIEHSIKKMGTTFSPHIKMSIAQDYDSSPSIFRGVSIAIHDDYVSSLNKRDEENEKDRMQLIENVVLRKILQESQVKNIYPVTEIFRPEVEILDNTIHAYDVENNTAIPKAPKLSIPSDKPLPFSHFITQIQKVRSELNLKGKGVTIGVIDSGVDYRHPAFGGGFGAGYPVRYGYDLVGNRFNSKDPFSKTVHDTPLDACVHTNGHGTHVAGIIAADDKLYNLTGVAPEVTLGAWRVFSCEGSTSNDLVIQAILKAYDAGCDIINLSLGSASNWPNDPTSIIANRVVEKGTIVVSAAGNDGNAGAFYVSAPGSGLKAVSVASVDNEYNLLKLAKLNNGESFPYLLSTNTTGFPSKYIELYSDKDTRSDACRGVKPSNLISDKIALIQRGGCTLEEKLNTAKKFGAVGALVYDDISAVTVKPLTAKSDLPFATIGYDAGQKLKAILKYQDSREGIRVQFGDTLTRQNVKTKNEVSGFSSMGPLYDMSLKPDLAAPGGFIFSTLPLNNGGYGIMSGTSMAAPYVAGTFALYLEKYGKNHTIEYIKEHFQNYAQPTVIRGEGTEFLENPARQGAGIIQLYDTMSQAVHVSPGSISFNDTDHTESQTLKINNPSEKKVQYKINYRNSLTINPYDILQRGLAPLPAVNYGPLEVSAKLKIEPSEITLLPGEQTEIKIDLVSVGQNQLLQPFPIYGGYIQFTPNDDRLKTIHVPYVGIRGSLSDLPIFDLNFPRVRITNATKVFSKQIEGKKVEGVVLERSKNASYIESAFRLLTGTTYMKTEVLDHKSETVGLYVEDHQLSRNILGQRDYFFIQRWNGTVFPVGKRHSTRSVQLKPGVYYLKWSALKLMSDPNLPGSWESETSVPILIED